MNKSMDIFDTQSETFSEINPLNEETGHLVRPEFSQLRDNSEVSVLIIGGGINGIGLFRELALQGIDALLVEKSDF